MSRLIDITGLEVGRLTVVNRVENIGSTTVWLCRCECGGTKEIRGSHLRNGATKSCGCLQIEAVKKMATKSGNCKSPVYQVWIDMKNRCHNTNDQSYRHYGGRGISVTEEWTESFINFETWCFENGWENWLQLDRIDNDGSYEPSNCRFITHRENTLNQRLLSSRNSSGYRGVSFHKVSGKYASRICINYKTTLFGYFDSKKEALEARNNYIIENNVKHEYKIQEWVG